MTMIKPVWEGVYQNFSEAPIYGDGYNGDEWIRQSLQKMIETKKWANEASLIPPLSNHREILLPFLAALVYQEKGKVRILDVGGGLGFTYYQTKCALPENNHLEFIIIENQAVCEAGAEFFRDEKDSPIFLSKMEDAEGAFDIIHLGSSLHYFEDWRLLIEQICQKSLKYLLIVDLPAGKIETFVTIQNLNDSKIPVWFFNVNEVIQQVHHNGFELIYYSSFQANIFNNTQILTMNNFPQKYRLYNTCNLLFSK